MPIDTLHPLYRANIAQRQMCRDAYDGEAAVKARAEIYLPKVDKSQDGQEYDAYRRRASHFGVVGRTVDGFVGAVARKDSVMTLPAVLADLIRQAAPGRHHHQPRPRLSRMRSRAARWPSCLCRRRRCVGDARRREPIGRAEIALPRPAHAVSMPYGIEGGRGNRRNPLKLLASRRGFEPLLPP